MSLTAVYIIEKPIWVDPDPLIGRTHAPVFMVKGGVEHFVINRVVYGSCHDDEKLREIKSMLLDTEGRYFKFYGPHDDPMQMLAEVKDRQHTFSNSKTLFSDCWDEPRYGAGFIDFSGACREVALTFSYRIYDPELVATLEEAAKSIIAHSWS